MAILSPSILSANKGNLLRDIKIVEEAGAKWLHIDVMDGKFVPNTSFGPDFVERTRKKTKMFLDVHLMVGDPELVLEEYAKAGADLLTVHVESNCCLSDVIERTHALGLKVGASLKPETPLSDIYGIIKMIDLVLIMSVNPGFSGQRFIPDSLNKIREAKLVRDRENSACLIEVDGGINLGNAAEVIGAGADVLVAGNAIFKEVNLAGATRSFLAIK